MKEQKLTQGLPCVLNPGKKLMMTAGGLLGHRGLCRAWGHSVRRVLCEAEARHSSAAVKRVGWL